MDNFTVCFSGHRKLNNPADIKIYTEIEIVNLMKRRADRFLCGMALGFDQLAAGCVLEFRRFYPHLKLVAVLPCAVEAQTKKWSAKNKMIYFDILNQADEIITLSEKYHIKCMMERNDYMVEHSRFCICYLEKETGGTAYTVNRALEKKLDVINIAEKYL